MGQWTQQQLTSGFATEPSNFAPAITASELGVDVFYAQATDGYPLGHLWVDAAGDTDWKYETLIDASNSDPVFSPPAALTRDNGIDVFVVCGGDGPAAMCWLRWPGNGGWLAPTPLPMAPQAFSGPAATSWNGTGRLDVFATVAPYTGGLEGKLVHWWLDLPINQATWASEILDSDGLVDQPCVTSWGAEHLDVFAMSGDGSLLHWSFDQPTGVNFGAPEILNGRISSPPCAVSYEPQRLDVFANSPQGILHWEYDATDPPAIVNFGDPEVLGGSQGCGQPCTVSWGPGFLDVFAASEGGLIDGGIPVPKGGLLHWGYRKGTGGVGGPDPRPAQAQENELDSTPAAVSASGGAYDIAAICNTGEEDVNFQMRKVLQVEYLAWTS